jgi:hypothetical protein
MIETELEERENLLRRDEARLNAEWERLQQERANLKVEAKLSLQQEHLWLEDLQRTIKSDQHNYEIKKLALESKEKLVVSQQE